MRNLTLVNSKSYLEPPFGINFINKRDGEEKSYAEEESETGEKDTEIEHNKGKIKEDVGKISNSRLSNQFDSIDRNGYVSSFPKSKKMS